MNDVATRPGTGLASRSTLLANLNKMAAKLPNIGGDYQYLKLDKNDGVWIYGQDDIEIDPNSIWAVAPQSFQHGYIAWHNNTPEHEILLPAGRDLPPIDTLPKVLAKNGYEEQQAVVMKCVKGGDLNVEVLYKSGTKGAVKFFGKLLNAILEQGESSNDIVPLLTLSSKSYENKKHGGVNWNPLFEIVEWRDPDDGTPVEDDDGDDEGDEAEAEVTQAAPPTRQRRRAEPAKEAAEAPAAANGADSGAVPRRRSRRA